jgi:hypothetical protein
VQLSEGLDLDSSVRIQQQDVHTRSPDRQADIHRTGEAYVLPGIDVDASEPFYETPRRRLRRVVDDGETMTTTKGLERVLQRARRPIGHH